MQARLVRFYVVALVLPAISFSGGHLYAQRFKVEEVADIVPGPESSHPGYFAKLGNDLVFAARHPQKVLYKTDGQTVAPLGDVRFIESFPAFAELNGELYFKGMGSNGIELFKTNGEQVVEVADISPGPTPSSPAGFTRLGDELFFSASGPNGRELYKTSGVDAVEVADLFPGSESSGAHPLARLGEELFFGASGPDGSGFYKTDGTSVVKLAELTPGPTDNYREIGGRLVFNATGPDGYGWYSTDGTDVITLDVEPSPILPDPSARLGDHLFFAADGPDGEELFKTDGLTAMQVADIIPGSGSSSPGPFTEFKGELYFPAYVPADAGVPDRELYRTDGNSVHQVQVADLVDTVWGSQPADLRAFKDELYFTALGPAGFDLYKTDGTNVVALDINPNGNAFFGQPGPVPTGISYIEFNGHLFFRAIGPDGPELFSTDGSSIFDYDISGGGFTEFNGELFFGGLGPNGLELYKISVVPEPSSLVLIVLATLIAGCCVGRRRTGG